MIFRHPNVADRNTQTEHLFELKLDGRFHFGDLRGKVFVV